MLRHGMVMGRDESLICLRQQLREQARPSTLTAFVRDKVLANFDFHMRQTAAFPVNRDGIVRLITHAVGFVIPDH